MKKTEKGKGRNIWSVSHMQANHLWGLLMLGDLLAGVISNICRKQQEPPSHQTLNVPGLHEAH